MKITIDGQTFVGNSVIVELESYFVLVNCHGEMLYHEWDGYSDWETASHANRWGFTRVKFETYEQAKAAADEFKEIHISIVEVKPDIPFVAFRSGGPH